MSASILTCPNCFGRLAFDPLCEMAGCLDCGHTLSSAMAAALAQTHVSQQQGRREQEWQAKHQAQFFGFDRFSSSKVTPKPAEQPQAITFPVCACGQEIQAPPHWPARPTCGDWTAWAHPSAEGESW